MTTKRHRPVPPLALAALISSSATLAPIAAAAEERIGIVLANRGDPVLIRDGEEQPVGRRDEIRAGDRLRTDDRSRLQLRLEDGQTLSLTENTELHIEDYAFDQESGTGESRKSLIEGGLRAITGQISGDGDYTIETEVATIGIRGTIFELSHGDGGTAGGTPRGRGFAENRGDSRQRVNTGDDAPVDYFRVTDPELPPEALSERPAELDALDEPAEEPADDPEETDEDEAVEAPPTDEETEESGTLAAAEEDSPEATPEPTSEVNLPAANVDASAGTDTDAASGRQDGGLDRATTDAEATFLVGIPPGDPFYFIEGDAVPEDDPRLEGLTLDELMERPETDGTISNSPSTGAWGDWIDDESGELGGPGIRGEAYLDTVDEDLGLTATSESLDDFPDPLQLQGGVLLSEGQSVLDGSVAISAEDQTVALEAFTVTAEGRTWVTEHETTNLFELATGIKVEGDIFILEDNVDDGELVNGIEAEGDILIPEYKVDDFEGDLAAMLSESDDIIELLGAFDFEADDHDWAVDGVFFLELDD